MRRAGRREQRAVDQATAAVTASSALAGFGHRPSVTDAVRRRLRFRGKPQRGCLGLLGLWSDNRRSSNAQRAPGHEALLLRPADTVDPETALRLARASRRQVPLLLRGPRLEERRHGRQHRDHAERGRAAAPTSIAITWALDSFDPRRRPLGGPVQGRPAASGRTGRRTPPTSSGNFGENDKPVNFSQVKIYQVQGQAPSWPPTPTSAATSRPRPRTRGGDDEETRSRNRRRGRNCGRC